MSEEKSDGQIMCELFQKLGYNVKHTDSFRTLYKETIKALKELETLRSKNG